MNKKNWQTAILAVTASMLLSACGGGGEGDPGTGAPAPSGSPPPPPPVAGGEVNTAPTITGSPGTEALVGVSYQFQPSAADIDGDTLTFSIGNRPAWASFDAGTGKLSGTPVPADVGMREGVTISVSDGTTVAALPPFNVTVTDVPIGSFALTASAGNGGSISPTGGVVRAAGSDQTFTITPNSGYTIAAVTVDGASVGAVSTYTFNDLTANHTISATFSAVQAPPPGTGTTASSITMYSGDSAITWTFDKAYTIGRFVTGDPYVVDTGGGVVVTSVSPNQAAGRNGSQVNPAIGGSQPFDNRSRCNFNAALRPTYPLTLRNGNSLVSTISVSAIDTEKEWNTIRTDDWSTVRSMAVLTVVDRVLPTGTFRPPYYGTNKPLNWNVANITTSWMPGLSTTGIRLPNYSSKGFATPVAYFKRGSERPWMVHLNNWCQREVAPHQNMFPYHQFNGFFVSEASLLLMTNVPNKDPVLHNMVQLGLDHYYLMGKGQEATSSFWKMPVLIAGLAFNNTAMLNSFKAGNYNVIPRDDEKFYDCSANPTGRGSSSWTGKGVCFKKEPDEYYEEE